MSSKRFQSSKVHSLRSSFVTELARQGVAMLDTMALTTPRSVETLRRYYRPAYRLTKRPGRDDSILSKRMPRQTSRS